MKSGIHPDYHPVVFQDANTGAMFLTRSTLTSSRTIEWQTPHGVHTYPLVVVEVSSDSHPFWTGGRRIVDSAGQVEKFHRRYGSRQPPALERDAEAAPLATFDYAGEKLNSNGIWGQQPPGTPTSDPAHRCIAE
jgi:large subunit ribosomal protein L31